MPKVKINQKPPVCPGCRKTITKVELIHSTLYIGDEQADMLAYCCGNDNCGMVLPVQVRPVEKESKLVSLH